MWDDQVPDLLCLQIASYLEGGPLMWMMPLHLHVNQKSDYDYMKLSVVSAQIQISEYFEKLFKFLRFYCLYYLYFVLSRKA